MVIIQAVRAVMALWGLVVAAQQVQTLTTVSSNAPVNVSAGAGATVSQLITKPSGAQSVRLFVGTGGTGGQGFSQFIGGNGNRSRSKCRRRRQRR